MATTETTFGSISPTELGELCRNGRDVDLVDVRTPAEFREVHSIHARNVPLDSLKPEEVMKSRQRPDELLYVICRSGNRSGKACEAFVRAGYTNVVNVEGGTSAWEQAGLPVERGKKTMSLERQVRIAAGSLVAIGTALGVLNPCFLVIPGFVGCGLVFAGITDTCGMGMLIARMPWNRAGSCNVNSSGADGGVCRAD